MKFLAAAIASALLLVGSAYARPELDKALGAGSYMHPTGPIQGVWKGGRAPFQD